MRSYDCYRHPTAVIKFARVCAREYHASAYSFRTENVTENESGAEGGSTRWKTQKWWWRRGVVDEFRQKLNPIKINRHFFQRCAHTRLAFATYCHVGCCPVSHQSPHQWERHIQLTVDAFESGILFSAIYINIKCSTWCPCINTQIHTRCASASAAAYNQVNFDTSGFEWFVRFVLGFCLSSDSWVFDKRKLFSLLLSAPFRWRCGATWQKSSSKLIRLPFSIAFWLSIYCTME